MTGYDIFKRVCAILGYTDFSVNPDGLTDVSFWHILNQILYDLKLPETDTLSSVIKANQKQKEAIIYGSASLFAGSLKDIALANTFTPLYNAKRSVVLCESDTRTDVIPTPPQGGN